MKNRGFLFLFVMGAVMLVCLSCNKAVPSGTSLVVSKNSLSVSAAGGLQTISYTLQNVSEGSAVTLSVACSDDWILNLTTTDESIVFIVDENTAYESRETVITVSYPGAESKSIKVYQSEYVMSVGDYFCLTTDSNGNTEWYTVSKERLSVNIPQDDVVGIVFSLNTDRIGSLEKQTLAEAGVTEPHGLVISVRNAASGVTWGTKTLINNNSEDRVTYNASAYSDINGLKNTRTIWNYHSYSSNNFPAFYVIEQCNNGENEYVPAAPGNTTGWFMPSTGNLWDLIENVGQYSLSDYYNITSINFVTVSSASAINYLLESIEKISDADPFTSSELKIYCSSSEELANMVNSLSLGGSENQIHFTATDKQLSEGYLVRPVLAF